MPSPPSTGMIAPVMNAASEDAKNAIVPAISSGLASLPSGTAAVSASRRSSESAANMSVATGPGATTFAVIERLPSSRAIDRASPMSPDLEAE